MPGSLRIRPPILLICEIVECFSPSLVCYAAWSSDPAAAVRALAAYIAIMRLIKLARDRAALTV